MIENIYKTLSKEEQYLYNPNDELELYKPDELIHTIEIRDIAIIEATHLYSWSEIARLDYMVSSNYRNRGIATYLIYQMLIALFKIGYTKFKCQVHKNNIASIKLLQKFGFEKGKQFSDFYYFDKTLDMPFCCVVQ